MSGKIAARFVLDKNGMPEFEQDTKGRKHYRIDLQYDPAGATDVRAVTFVLDENSYPDPIRLADKSVNYTERISSYGDFPIIAKVEADGFSTASGILSKLLRRGHSDAASNPNIAQAITEIAEN